MLEISSLVSASLERTYSYYLRVPAVGIVAFKYNYCNGVGGIRLRLSARKPGLNPLMTFHFPFTSIHAISMSWLFAVWVFVCFVCCISCMYSCLSLLVHCNQKAFPCDGKVTVSIVNRSICSCVWVNRWYLQNLCRNYSTILTLHEPVPSYVASIFKTVWLKI